MHLIYPQVTKVWRVGHWGCTTERRVLGARLRWLSRRAPLGGDHEAARVTKSAGSADGARTSRWLRYERCLSGDCVWGRCVCVWVCACSRDSSPSSTWLLPPLPLAPPTTPWCCAPPLCPGHTYTRLHTHTRVYTCIITYIYMLCPQKM